MENKKVYPLTSISFIRNDRRSFKYFSYFVYLNPTKLSFNYFFVVFLFGIFTQFRFVYWQYNFAINHHHGVNFVSEVYQRKPRIVTTLQLILFLKNHILFCWMMSMKICFLIYINWMMTFNNWSLTPKFIQLFTFQIISSFLKTYLAYYRSISRPFFE